MKGTEQTIAIVVSIIGVALVGFLGMSNKSTSVEQQLAQKSNYQPSKQAQPQISTSSEDTFSDEDLEDHQLPYKLDEFKGGRRKKQTYKKKEKKKNK